MRTKYVVLVQIQKRSRRLRTTNGVGNLTVSAVVRGKNKAEPVRQRRLTPSTQELMLSSGAGGGARQRESEARTCCMYMRWFIHRVLRNKIFPSCLSESLSVGRSKSKSGRPRKNETSDQLFTYTATIERRRRRSKDQSREIGREQERRAVATANPKKNRRQEEPRVNWGARLTD